jgi:hypothetical protein
MPVIFHKNVDVKRNCAHDAGSVGKAMLGILAEDPSCTFVTCTVDSFSYTLRQGQEAEAVHEQYRKQVAGRHFRQPGKQQRHWAGGK